MSIKFTEIVFVNLLNWADICTWKRKKLRIDWSLMLSIDTTHFIMFVLNVLFSSVLHIATSCPFFSIHSGNVLLYDFLMAKTWISWVWPRGKVYGRFTILPCTFLINLEHARLFDAEICTAVCICWDKRCMLQCTFQQAMIIESCAHITFWIHCQ